MSGREIEAKLYVRSLEKVELRLRQLDAHLVQPRILEINRRFDFPDRRLTRAGQALRLRQDTQPRLTYKGQGISHQGVLNRTELEITISDAGIARQILEALGYLQCAVYEKFRRVYELEACKIMLDELPYGNFVEIEGPNIDFIHNMTARLGLDIGRAVELSYLGIHEHYCARNGLDPGTLTFGALEGRHPTAKELGLAAADESD